MMEIMTVKSKHNLSLLRGLLADFDSISGHHYAYILPLLSPFKGHGT